MGALSQIFHALADPTRRAILARLMTGESSVSELAEPFEMTLPAVSKHLKVLERAGLISRGREAQFRPARIEPKGLIGVEAWIETTAAAGPSGLRTICGRCKTARRPRPARPVRTAANSRVSGSLEAIMVEHSAAHGVFVLERQIEAPPEQASAAFATAAGKARWFHGPQAQVVTREFDFRVGGRERLHCRWPPRAHANLPHREPQRCPRAIPRHRAAAANRLPL